MAAPSYFAWDFHTLIEAGPGCRSFVAQRFMEMGCKRVAMITDQGLINAGIAGQIQEIFAGTNTTKLAGVYDKIAPDAARQVVNDCAKWCRENDIDGLLGVGGGSVLDSVKGVKAMLGMGANDIKDIMPANVGLYMRPQAKPLGIPNISIPTTAGTGSEVSPIAVIYDEEQKVKGALLHPYIPPEYALLDAELTVGLPSLLTAYTGFDAFSHAIEGLTCPYSNPMIDALSLQAIRLINKYLPLAVKDGENLEARHNMLIASNIAIMSFAMAGPCNPVHNIAHAVGGQLRIPHGQAVATALPNIMEYASYHFIQKAEDLAYALGLDFKEMDAAKTVAVCRERVLELMDKCGLKPIFDQVLGSQEKETLYNAVKSDPTGLVYPLPDDAIKQCLNACFPHK